MLTSISLYTNKLKQLRRFYMNVMGFDIIEQEDTQFTVKIGNSAVTFIHTDVDAFYHFAINIPGNQFTIIKDWVNTNYKLNKEGGITQIYNEQFDADSMFLEDPAGNLIQLIGRRNRDFFGNFTKDAFYDISEITIVTPFVEEVGEHLQDIGLPLLNGFIASPDKINYLGKDDAYIVLVKDGRKIKFLQNKLETYPLEIKLNTGKRIELNKDGIITISDINNTEPNPSE